MTINETQKSGNNGNEMERKEINENTKRHKENNIKENKWKEEKWKEKKCTYKK